MALAHPPGCRGCPLDERGHGFAPADGPSGSWLLLVGESLGVVEAMTGRPFMGDAGGMLTRLLNLLGWQRDAIRIHNTISCHPPNDWFDERAPCTTARWRTAPTWRRRSPSATRWWCRWG